MPEAGLVTRRTSSETQKTLHPAGTALPQIIELQRFFHEEERKRYEHAQCDHFLQQLQLPYRKLAIADAVAGTCNTYSNSAMPQLASAAIYQAWCGIVRRCEYHANVMNTLLANSRQIVMAMGASGSPFEMKLCL